MKLWHTAWLSAHPYRTEEWLREKLRDGFDVHHMDGDKANNDSSNLVLIEHVDHMRLHGSPNIKLGRLGFSSRGPRRAKQKNDAVEKAMERAAALRKELAQMGWPNG